MQWSSLKFLDQWVDEGLEVEPGWSPEDEATRQLERLVPATAVALLVRDHPGRMPESAGRIARKNDKLTARRVYSRLLMYTLQWGGTTQEVHTQTLTSECRQQAAQLDWSKWWQTHRSTLELNMRKVATQAKKNGHLRAGNRYLNRLSNEYRALDEVLDILTAHSTPSELDDA